MALELNIPGRGAVKLTKIIFDLNGTLTVDGRMRKETLSLLKKVAEVLEIYILTADTLGSAMQIDWGSDIDVHIVSGENTSRAKIDFLELVGPLETMAVGNGTNDAGMLEKAALSIAVLGPEGCALEALRAAELVVRNIDDALCMILKPRRLIASLRC
ncbi:MAG: ATPase P [Firmicutes bacterium]|nr:ATPase P [Bacillota bacterium]